MKVEFTPEANTNSQTHRPGMNQRKQIREGNVDKTWESHRVSPNEAEQVSFNRPLIVTDDDRALFVAFTLRGELIRVISARDMIRLERKVYQG